MTWISVGISELLGVTRGMWRTRKLQCSVFINKGGYQDSQGTPYAFKEEKLGALKFQISNRGASHCFSY